MNIETLKALLNPGERKRLFTEIMDFFDQIAGLERIVLEKHETKDGIIPIIYLTNDDNNIKSVKLFVGAQHNEYNGLFGIIEFLFQHSLLFLLKPAD